MLSDLFVSDPSVLLMEPLRSIASLKKLSIWSNVELVSFTNESEQWFLKVRSSLSELNFLFLKSLTVSPFLLGKPFFSPKTLHLYGSSAQGITKPPSLLEISVNTLLPSRLEGALQKVCRF
ncbi:hypothetical protein MA16_Dca011406 [Dendrobium catenatum]|uniref:Uncharacterized protein n=1 Tax=Dendrobium catenatum TaxID=906689 RepID=A0A2I0WP10_9ASPA|nr:hypothetical protein MA16_Dca011406 [Dendrobium catenatum]